MGLSIAFGHEELLALAEVLGESLPALGVDPLADRSRAVRAEALAVARRSLRARNVLRPGDGPGEVTVALAAARLVEILCRPALAATVHRGAGWTAPPTRFAAIPEATVAQAWDDGVHRLTPFATGELLARLLAAAGVDHDLAPAPDALAVPGEALARALAAPDAARAREALAGGGTDPVATEAVLAALAGAGPAAIGVTRRPTGGRVEGAEVAWLTGPDGTWSLPASVTPLGGLVGRDVEVAAPVVVSLVPTSGADLLAAVALATEAPS